MTPKLPATEGTITAVGLIVFHFYPEAACPPLCLLLSSIRAAMACCAFWSMISTSTFPSNSICVSVFCFRLAYLAPRLGFAFSPPARFAKAGLVGGLLDATPREGSGA